MKNQSDQPVKHPTPCGVVHAVRGAVVDVVFAETDLPQINSALIVECDRPTPLILEVHSHLDQSTVRAEPRCQ